MNDSVNLKAIDPFIKGRFMIFNSIGRTLFIYDEDDPDHCDRTIPEELLNKSIYKIYAGGQVEPILIIYIESQEKQAP